MRTEGKKYIILILVGILFLSGSGAGQNVTNESTHATKTVQFSFANCMVQDTLEKITITLQGTDSVLMKPGYYEVPTTTKVFTFPKGTRITAIQCIPEDIQYQTVKNAPPVASVPLPVISDASRKIFQGTPQSMTTWFTYRTGMGLISEHERGLILSLQLIPVRYDPKNHQIAWAKTLHITIDYTVPQEHIKPCSDQYKFIVIAPDAFTAVLTPFIQHKVNTMQLSTKLVTLNDIYNSVYFPVNGRDNQEKIKYFIKNAIESWGTDYVLLVGGSAQVPVRISHAKIDGDPDNGVYVSDLYYADIYNSTEAFSSWDTNNNNVFGECYYYGRNDTVDLYPDVALGRLACTDTGQVTTCVNKIKNYEAEQSYTKDWFESIVAIGGDSFCKPQYPEDTWGWDEGEKANQAALDILGFDPSKVQKIWATNGKLIDPNAVGVISNAINQGTGFVFFSGHGNTNVWSTHPHNDSTKWIPAPSNGYLTFHVNALTNGGKLPITVISACWVAKFESEPACISWSFVSNPNGGSICTLSPTAISFGEIGPNDLLGYDTLQCLEVFRAYIDPLTSKVGDMWRKAISAYVDHGLNDPAADTKTVEIFILFGDPTLTIRETPEPPAIPSIPSGPTTGQTFLSYSYSTSTNDPNTGDQLWFNFSWDDGIFSDWIGPFDSDDVAVASHSWNTPGDKEMKVKAKDTAGLESDWSASLLVTITENPNHPPGTPSSPSGPTSGKIMVDYTYMLSPVSDPENDDVYYLVDWGDGNTSGWLGPYHSGDPVPPLVYNWSKPGTYDVRVKAKDDKEAQSDYSAALQVTIVKPEPQIIIEITGGKGITLMVKNVGEAEATNVQWTMSISGGLFINATEFSGTIGTLIPDEDNTSTILIRGIGLGKIRPMPIITAVITFDGGEVETFVNAKILGRTVTIQQ